MKCPQCGLVTFDDLPGCPRCKESFALVRPLASASLDGARHLLRDDPELRIKLRDRLHRARLDRRRENDNPLAVGVDPDAPDWFEPDPDDEGGSAEAMFATAPVAGERSEEAVIVHSDDLSTEDEVRGGAATADAEPDLDDDGPDFDGDIPGFSDWREELRERLKRIRARREQEAAAEADDEGDETAVAEAVQDTAAEKKEAAESDGEVAEVVEIEAAADEEREEVEPSEHEEPADDVEASDEEADDEAADDEPGELVAKEEVDEQEAEEAAEATEAEEDVEPVAADADAEPEEEEAAEEDDVAPNVRVVGFGAASASGAIDVEVEEPKTTDADGDEAADEPVTTAGDLIARIVDGRDAVKTESDADPEPVAAGSVEEIDLAIEEEPEVDVDHLDLDDPEEAGEPTEHDGEIESREDDEAEPDGEIESLEGDEAEPELEFDEAEPAVAAAALELDLTETDAEQDRAFEWDEESVEVPALSSAGPLGERAAAVLCDALILTAIGSALVGAAASGTGLPFRQVLAANAPVLCLTWAIFAVGYSVFFVGSCGQTIGRMVMRLRVVGNDQFSVGFQGAAVRLAAWVVSALPLFAGMLLAFNDPENRGLHDRLSRTRVVKA